MMRLSHLSTLWDYIRRAMPWNAPKSLAPDEVYALVAYILSLADVVPADYTLNERNIAEVDRRLPNRNGKVFFPGLWDVAGRGDTANTACMKNCPVEGRTTSAYPDSELGSHGNLAEQNRPIGPVRGLDAGNGRAAGAASAPR
jgi:cytochrome c